MESSNIVVENHNLELLSICAHGVSIAEGISQQTQEQELVSFNAGELSDLLSLEDFTTSNNVSNNQDHQNLYLDWENEIPDVNVQGVPNHVKLYADEVIEFHSSVTSAIDNAIT